jgi:AraC family transcriptional regulator of adaptative response / DNA-3-methyladenine glycosylase II
LRWPDAFPAGDLALRKAFGKDAPMPEAHLLELAEDWRPWRAYAAMYLWSSLSWTDK